MNQLVNSSHEDTELDSLLWEYYLTNHRHFNTPMQHPFSRKVIDIASNSFGMNITEHMLHLLFHITDESVDMAKLLIEFYKEHYPKTDYMTVHEFFGIWGKNHLSPNKIALQVMYALRAKS